MFNLFKKKKKIETKNIKEFNDWIKAIDYFIATEDWENSKKAIGEIRIKEKKAYNGLIQKIEEDDKSSINDTEKKKQIRIYNSKIKILDELSKKTEDKEKKYNDKIEKERFKIRFTKIKNEITVLFKTNKNNEALNLLSNFLEENKKNKLVINFYNKEKKKILKNLEKERRAEEEKMKKNTKLEALKLIWETINIKKEEDNKKEKESKKSTGLFYRIKSKINFYKKIQEKLKQKRLFDEVNILIEEDSKAKKDIASKKLENIHKWLIKELTNNKMLWYDFYWKILWADKISWDTFGFSEWKKKYNFFLWDATWHGIKAGFIVTLLSRIFNKYVEKSPIQKLTYEINNWLKQDLKSRNFITWIFFEINKEEIWKIKFVWMWHEPMLVYRASSKKVESIIPGWLAAWIRIIKKEEDIKVKEIELKDWDILLTYSDWIIETKNLEWNFYWIKKLEESFNKISKVESNINKIYDYIIKDLKSFRWWTSFLDDATILVLKRNGNKDVIVWEDNKYIKELSLKEWLSKKQTVKLTWKTKEEIQKELEKIKKEKEIKNIIKNLENLFYTWEVLKLKQEAIRFIKKWYIDKKINFYLKKAIANEAKYKIEQKNQKIQNKYNVLKELFKKWDYATVIKETEDIIAKDWNI